ncbi:MAG: glycosyltransferase family 2 protein [Nitrospirota bacterium]
MDISVIIPVFNEEKNVKPLYEQILDSMERMGVSFEIIFIDDGSIDNTFKILQDIHNKDKRLKVIRFRKNFGQTAAISAGFDYSKGNIIITLDGDLQNDPGDMPLLVEKLNEGYDIVSGWRYKRKDPFFRRRLPSMIANRLISFITNVKLHDYGCSLKAFKKDVIKNIRLYGEMHRFIPAVASWMGISVAEVKVNHRPREEGRSKYGLSRTIRVILDLITVKFLLSYSTRPIQIFGLIGIISSAIGGIILFYLSFIRIILQEPIGGRPLLLLGILLFFIGVQFISMGLLAEMQSRTYHETQDKPIYVVKEILE